eukprot:2836741-Rhodomonas_salina.1
MVLSAYAYLLSSVCTEGGLWCCLPTRVSIVAFVLEEGDGTVGLGDEEFPWRSICEGHWEAREVVLSPLSAYASPTKLRYLPMERLWNSAMRLRERLETPLAAYASAVQLRDVPMRTLRHSAIFLHTRYEAPQSAYALATSLRYRPTPALGMSASCLRTRYAKPGTEARTVLGRGGAHG